jgi:hypothetical protein
MKTDSAFLRLRAANPFADEAHSTADDELFARITAAAREPRATRRSYRRPVVAIALALLAVAVLASTAFAVSRWIGGDVVKPDVTQAEYRDAQRELSVPPGFAWPPLHTEPNSVTTRGGGGGHAVLIAQNAWECYWVQSIQRKDTGAQRRAHARLDSLLRNNTLVAPAGAPEDWVPANPPDRPYAVFAQDGGYEWVQEAYALAAAGHPQRLAERCRANAPG